MVDTTEALEGQYLNAQIVKASQNKELVVIQEGSYEETDFGKRLTIIVKIDGKEKIWRPNKDSIRNMNVVYGPNTLNWVGKKANLQVISVQGKDSVLAFAQPVVKDFNYVKIGQEA